MVNKRWCAGKNIVECDICEIVGAEEISAPSNMRLEDIDK